MSRRVEALMKETTRQVKADATEHDEMTEHRQYLDERAMRNDMPFIWTDADAIANRDVVPRALEMAGRGDLLPVADEYYITDRKQDFQDRTASLALLIKYGRDAQVKQNQMYYLCLI